PLHIADRRRDGPVQLAGLRVVVGGLDLVLFRRCRRRRVVLVRRRRRGLRLIHHGHVVVHRGRGRVLHLDLAREGVVRVVVITGLHVLGLDGDGVQATGLERRREPAGGRPA